MTQKKTPNNFEILHTFPKIIYIWYLQIYYISNVVAGRLEIKHGIKSGINPVLILSA